MQFEQLAASGSMPPTCFEQPAASERSTSIDPKQLAGFGRSRSTRTAQLAASEKSTSIEFEQPAAFGKSARSQSGMRRCDAALIEAVGHRAHTTVQRAVCVAPRCSCLAAAAADRAAHRHRLARKSA